MKYKKNTILIFLLLLTFVNYSQTSEVTKADKKYNDLAYFDALEIYEKLAKTGFDDEDVLKKIADSYYFNADYLKAVSWYARLVNKNQNLSPNYLFRYGQSLKATGNFDKADFFLKRFYLSQGVSFTNSKTYLNEIKENSNKYIVNTVDFNTENSDYPAFLHDDKLYVISGSERGKKTPWNNEPTSDIFLLKGEILINVSDTLNTEFNEGSLVITKDGETMFFTRNDYNNKIKGNNSNKTTLLKIYMAQNIDGKWEGVKEFPFNDSEYSVGHPALSNDGKTLYFVSNMQGNGGKGGTDIYEVSFSDNGVFGVPKNLAAFNTTGNESFPFVGHDGTFYFSSNGYVSNLGGLDVYSATANKDGSYNEVVNIGRPINSGMDDFAIQMDSISNKGYFSSNRSGTNSDDIFSLIKNIEYIAPCSLIYKGVVRDLKSGDILENALVSLVDADNKILFEKVAAGGLYEFDEMDCATAKFVRAEKSGYQTGEELLSEPIEGISTTDVLLSKSGLDLAVGTDLGLFLNPIYFDLDKSNIRPDAEIELQKIIAIMTATPLLNVDVRSHTDSRAPDDYNLLLSSRRAKSTIEYIIRGGVDRARLTSQGYGETQLKNGCSNGVDCYEGEHQLNRRSEFIIVN